MENETVAGWYPDPTGSSDLRYWNGTEWTEHTAAAQTKTRIGLWIALSGLVLAVSPIFLAFFIGLTQGSSMWSEGGEGAGAAIWLMFFTVPAGVVVVIVGLIVGAANTAKQIKSTPR